VQIPYFDFSNADFEERWNSFFQVIDAYSRKMQIASVSQPSSRKGSENIIITTHTSPQKQSGHSSGETSLTNSQRKNSIAGHLQLTPEEGGGGGAPVLPESSVLTFRD
jgi:hypothetical protein